MSPALGGNNMSGSIQKRLVGVIRGSLRMALDGEMGQDTELTGSGLALDSIAVLELLNGIEREFDIEADVNELLAADALRTVGTLTRSIESRLATGRF